MVDEFSASVSKATGERGYSAKLIQEWLCLQGHNVLIDGVYGPATKAAVKNFQVRQNLNPSGDVSDETYALLLRPLQLAIRPIKAHGRSFGDMIVLHARQHLAAHPREVGGENCGPWVRLYMNGQDGVVDGVPQAWCAGYASFIIQAASRDCGLPVPFELSASCTVVGRNAQAAGFLESRYGMNGKPMSVNPGSLFLSRVSTNHWSHIGIITKTDTDSMTTDEGNCNEVNGPDGFEVCKRTRNYDGKDFIVWKGPYALPA